MKSAHVSACKYKPAPWSDILGDRRGLAQTKNVPFSIKIYPQPFSGQLSGLMNNDNIRHRIQTWDQYQAAEQLKVTLRLFIQANSALKHLSGGQFSLKLIEAGHTTGEIDLSGDNHGFTMHVKHIYPVTNPFGGFFGEYFYVNGHFYIVPVSFFAFPAKALTVGPIIHEIMHGLLGAHSNDEDGICNVFRPRIGLSQREADYLGWPHVPPVRIEVKNLIS